MKQIIGIAFCCLMAGLVHAGNILVKTPEEAVLALKRAKAGDTVALANGSYKDIALKFSANGSAHQPVVFTAETPGKVVFEGNSRLSFSGQYVVVDGFVWQNGGEGLEKASVIEFRTSSSNVAMYSVLQNCVVNNYNNSNKSIDNKWVSLYGQFNTVKQCLLKGKTNLGATLTVWLNEGEPANHTISHNYFLDRQNGPDADNGLETIRIGDSKTSMTDAFCKVEYNLFEACDGEIEIISNKSGKNIYFGNTFFNSNGGLTLRHGNGVVCEGNYFFGGNKEQSYGIRVIGENHVVKNNYFSGLKGHKDKFRAALTVVNGLENSPLNGYFQVKNLILSGNQFLNCEGPAIRFGSGRSDALLVPEDILVEKNVVLAGDKNQSNIIDYVTMPKKISMENNFTNRKVKGMSGWETAALVIKTNEEGILEIWHNNDRLSMPSKPLSESEVGPVWLQTVY